jgi:hypothetical protein
MLFINIIYNNSVRLNKTFSPRQSCLGGKLLLPKTGETIFLTTFRAFAAVDWKFLAEAEIFLIMNNFNVVCINFYYFLSPTYNHNEQKFRQ